MTTASLTPTAARGLEATVLLLRETTGFMFVPLLVESERAASAGLAFIQSQLDAKLYDVAWPVDAQSPTEELRFALLRNLDDAIAKLPPNAVLVLDASSSVRHALALAVVAYINHRREPLRAGGLRLLLCWPVALKDELLSNAPDLWSVRAASPWLAEEDLLLPLRSQTDMAPATFASKVSAQQALPLALAQMLERWHTHRDLKVADLSPRDALALADAQIERIQWADAAGLAEAVAQSLQNLHHADSGDLALKVHALNTLGHARRQQGNPDGALNALREATRLARQLATENPAAYEFDLARSISNLAVFLSETGDRAGALVSAQEAVALYKRLAKTNPAEYEKYLASSINNLAGRLSATGAHDSALEASQEAVKIYKRLAKANPAAYAADMALSTHNLANCLSDIGDRSGALVAAQDAVEIFKHLAKAKPDAYEADLAMSILNLSNRLSDIDDYAGALVAVKESLEIFSRLAKINPAAHEANVAGGNQNLALFLGHTGDDAGALKAVLEALSIFRRLAKANPAVYEFHLASCLYILANLLKNNGDRADAISTAKEALRFYEQANHSGMFDAQLSEVREFVSRLSED